MNRIEVNERSINVLRIMLSGIFLIAGINHVVFPGHVANVAISGALLFFIMNDFESTKKKKYESQS